MPASFVVAVTVVPLATSVILTGAPGMTASLESLTLPEIVPRASCALAVAGAIKTIVAKTAMANACNNLDAAGFIFHPPSGWKTKLQPLACGLAAKEGVRRRIEAIL